MVGTLSYLGPKPARPAQEDARIIGSQADVDQSAGCLNQQWVVEPLADFVLRAKRFHPGLRLAYKQVTKPFEDRNRLEVGVAVEKLEPTDGALLSQGSLDLDGCAGCAVVFVYRKVTQHARVNDSPFDGHLARNERPAGDNRIRLDVDSQAGVGRPDRISFV